MARAIGVFLILAGVVALLYGGFDWSREVHTAAVGPVHFTLVDDQQLPISPLAGVIALGAGVVLFLISVPRTRRIG